MIKQRKDSITQFEAGGRPDLADIEKAELAILSAYMPAGLSDEEIAAEVAAAVAASGAAGPQDMGKVMAILKPKLAGRADMTRGLRPWSRRPWPRREAGAGTRCLPILRAARRQLVRRSILRRRGGIV